MGWLSDRLTPDFGDDALRYALLIGVLPYLWSVLHNLLASRTLQRDLRAKYEDPESSA